jgi:hypothetical protein
MIAPFPIPSRLAAALLPAFLGLAPLAAQDAAVKETFTQAKAAWATQGDRETAAGKFGAVLAALEPKAAQLDPGWIQVLCETYNWMAILEDRVAARREKAPRYLESALNLNPDFEIDRNITNARLQAAFDTLRGARFGKVTLHFDPSGGTLAQDGRPPLAVNAAQASHYLLPGAHVFRYSRPGFDPAEADLELAPKEAKALELKLTRTSSAISVFTVPAGAQLALDGKAVGSTQGQAPPEMAASAGKLGVGLEQVSAGFVLTGLAPGKHLLEVSSPCYQPKRIEIGESFTTPFDDHLLEPIKLEPSRALLSVSCPVPGGELFLSGRSYGPVPVKDLAVCAQPYDLQVHFPAGAFAQHLDLAEGQSLALAVRPRPRLTYVGFEGTDTFAGRERIEKLLAELGARLSQVAYLTAAAGESPEDCLARVNAAHETELVLRARLLPGDPVHPVELSIATLTGEVERVVVKPLESDPMGPLVARLEAPLRLSTAWAGLVLLDQDAGAPLVLQADADAQKAGVKLLRPVQQLNGKPLASVADFQKGLEAALAPALASGQPGKVTLGQGESPLTLAVTSQAVELPVNAAGLCYPLVLADLRLRYLGASGDEASLLRLQQALALIHFREFDKALELLRDARMVAVQGVSQGTLDYYTGVCLQRLGDAYQAETLQAYSQALKYPQATLFGPDGPLLAPLAGQALDDLKPNP